MPSVNLPYLIDVQAERARRSLHYFLRVFAWPVLMPGKEFEDNWHIGALCEHLEAVKRGQIQRLLVNMPYRNLKSTIVSHAFPAWDWIDNPSRQILSASYGKDLAIRDAVDARRIIESPRYQRAFGDRFRLTSDQNVKSRYENDKRGMRTAISRDSGGTGYGGDLRIIDDPANAKDADNPNEIKESVEWFKGTFTTRANDPKNSPMVVVHQRLSCNDLTGYLLEHQPHLWDHLVLPMRYDPKLRKTTSLGFQDPRKTPGQLLHPERLPEEVVKTMETDLGTYHTNAQLQQNPDPRGGVIFQRDHWRYWRALPELDEVVVTVDCTFKSLQTSDHVAIQAWGNRGANDYLLPGRIKERMGFSATVTSIKSMVALYPQCVAVLIEDKANGSAVIETLSSQVSGVLPINPQGGKAARAFAMQPAHEAGNVWVPDPSVDPTIESFIGTCSRFTGAEGGDDDEVDAMTQYINWRRARNQTMGLQEFMRAQAEARMKAAASGGPASPQAVPGPGVSPMHALMASQSR